jgi:hypothetical protein
MKKFKPSYRNWLELLLTKEKFARILWRPAKVRISFTVIGDVALIAAIHIHRVA